ncbi:adenylate/guanylate cyclase domain-containing protein [Bradyrhizobium sp. SRL28]|nr:adenylate/guanylate cyclase domain-containing protein [Bradyrhizobium sp. SRL28]
MLWYVRRIYRSREAVLTDNRVERRLAAILAADVAGYSRLTGLDEEGTHVRLRERLRGLADPKISEHRGKVVKHTGDGVLAEFGSVVDAVRCAIEVQRGMAEQNATMPQAKRIEFRIGIHVGDIIVDDNDIFGDGVNIAARLEGIAEPGGVCISDDAQRQVRGKVNFAFEDMGPQNLKNIVEPMRAWRLRMNASGSAAAPNEPPVGSTQALALPDKPSIAVLPFENMSGDPEQDYFADGMVEDIITGLSRSKSLFVIARNSSFTYKGKAVDIKQVGRELGVRYVLEGSVRKAGNRVRITGQLINAETANHIWADRYDSTLEDIFDLQDRVTTSVIGAIAPQLEWSEIARAQRKPTESLQAYDYYLRALASFYRFTPEANIEALKLTRTANNLDPGYAAPFALGATCYVQRWGFGWNIADAEDETEARRLTRRALELGKDDPLVLALAGQALGLFIGEVQEGSALLARAISLDPNLAAARFWNGYVQLYLGDGDAAIEQFQIGLRMSPLDPRIYLAQNGIAAAHFSAGRYEDGSLWAKIAVQQNPNFVAAHHTLIACHAMAGRVEEARQAWAVARQIDPTQRLSTVLSKRYRLRRSKDIIQRYAEAFRIVGMPE